MLIRLLREQFGVSESIHAYITGRLQFATKFVMLIMSVKNTISFYLLPELTFIFKRFWEIFETNSFNYTYEKKSG